MSILRERRAPFRTIGLASLLASCTNPCPALALSRSNPSSARRRHTFAPTATTTQTYKNSSFCLQSLI